MTLAFDSPLLVSKATWLYVRPADRHQRSISASERQLLSLLERRRRRYLARKECVEVERKESHERTQPTHVLSATDLGVDDGHCACVSLGMHPHPSSRQLRFGDTASPGSRARTGLKRRTQVKSHPDEDVKHRERSIHGHNDRESCCSREGSALTRYGE